MNLKVFAGSSFVLAGPVEETHRSLAKRVPALLLTGLLAISLHGSAAQVSLPLTGNLLGSVMDVAGIPQMGATVQIFNKYDRPISKTLTTADGRFAFAALPIDLYSVRVSLASFLPAARDQIAVKAGLDSVLQIHLATLFSNIQVSYTLPDGAMTNDWKWVLRSSPATRPITRFLPLDEESSGADSRPRIFSGTRAMLSLSGGDGGLVDTGSAAGDFGTGFVLSTNIFGKNQVELGGTFGPAAALGPTALSICAIYSRNDNLGFGQPPEVTFTLSQLGVETPQMAGLQNTGTGGVAAGPAVRSMSLSVYEVTDALDNVQIEYGMTGESVEYLQHTMRVSPFARMTVTLGSRGQLIGAYSDGGRPDELTAHQQYKAAEYDAPDSEMASAVNTLARLPQLSERNGRLELERRQNYEIGYRKTIGSRTYAASAFYEDVTNGRVNMAGDLSGVDAGNLFYDGVSATSTYNIGNYQRYGYVASLDQRVSAALDVALAYGRMGGMVASGSDGSSNWGGQGKFFEEKNRNVASANLDARVPKAGMKLEANYGWVENGALVPRHIFTTQNVYVQPGLNINVRQPLPSLFGLPGRLELTADLRNLLAQGYLPLDTGGGHRLLIVQSPRAIRGGLNFIF